MSEVYVSVIMPCYNGAEYLKQSIFSYLQNCSPLSELIVVDDGSTDDSPKIVCDYQKENPECNIRYFRTINCGVSHARNYGLKRAMGKFVLFLDCDDCFSLHFIKSLVEAADDNKSDLTYCYWRKRKSQLSKGLTRYVNKKTFAKSILYHNKNIHLCSIIYRKEIIVSNNLSFREDLKYGEDLDFIWNYLVRCETFCFCSRCYYYYRTNTNSAMHKFSFHKLDTIQMFKDNESLISHNYSIFLKEYNHYAVQRCVLAIQKELASNNEKEMFLKIWQDYRQLSYSHLLIHDNLLNRLAALLYILFPKMFFFLIYKIGGKL